MDRAATQRTHRGAVRERSQGLSLRNPWIYSIAELHPGGMRERRQASPHISRIPPGCTLSYNATRGFEDSTPGYVLTPLRGEMRREPAHHFGMRRSKSCPTLPTQYDHRSRAHRVARTFQFGLLPRLNDVLRAGLCRIDHAQPS